MAGNDHRTPARGAREAVLGAPELLADPGEVLVRLRGAKETLAALEGWLSAGDKYICCDEVGLGVVPVDFAEREFRDEVGRALCALAKRAERVFRVIAGIGQRIR